MNKNNTFGEKSYMSIAVSVLTTSRAARNPARSLQQHNYRKP